MKTTLTLMLTLSLFLTWSQAEAQGTRYLDEVFNEVQIDTGIQYATNISVLTGTPQPVDLLMDVYTPAGDTEDNRPVMIVFHSGFYLPQYINDRVYGGLQDSSVVNICERLARRGYVAVAATYRLGWNPLSFQSVITGSFINAVYRSIQDARTCIRFLRMTVAEEDNPYGIASENIGLWGIGEGGYIVYGSAFLDRYEETLLPQFLNEDLEVYIDDDLSGDPYGLNEAPLNIPNHADYSSDFKFGLNMGGALLDTSWIEGNESPIPEPNLVGFHVVTDPWAPFGIGSFLLPIPPHSAIFYPLYGTRAALGKLNEIGGNAELDAALGTNADFPLNTFMTAYMEALTDVPFTGPLGQSPTTLSTRHLYSFIPPPSEVFPLRVESDPWNWHDKATLDTVIAAINLQSQTALFNADALHQNALATNPDMSAEKGNRYLDSIFAYAMPRACLSFGLRECLTVGTEDVIHPISVDLKLFPNPAVEQLTIQTDLEHPIREVHLFDLGGRLVRSDFNINTATYQLRREHLPSGLYFAKIKLDEGWVVQKLTFK